MGLHYTVRLPTYGRTLGYHSPSAETLVGCTGTEVYRFNLEEGRYMQPLQVAKGWGDGMGSSVEGVNVVDVSPRHGLWSFGLDGGGGVVEFWDPRSRTALTRLKLPGSTLLPVRPYDPLSTLPEQKLSVTALASHPTDGLSLAVGTSSVMRCCMTCGARRRSRSRSGLRRADPKRRLASRRRGSGRIAAGSSVPTAKSSKFGPRRM